MEIIFFVCNFKWALIIVIYFWGICNFLIGFDTKTNNPKFAICIYFELNSVSSG